MILFVIYPPYIKVFSKYWVTLIRISVTHPLRGLLNLGGRMSYSGYEYFIVLIGGCV
jgi:hypothetical protein